MGDSRAGPGAQPIATLAMRHHDEPSAPGFTLIELMIVVAILAILASLAVPNLVSSRSTANENVTVATLRTVSTAQFRFKSMALIDADRAGSYEYGSLPELSGVVDVRDIGERLTPGLISASFGAIDAAGILNRQGYLYALYLPSATGAGLPGIEANLAAVDARFAEQTYSLLAWPSAYGETGRTAYFVTEQGEVLKSIPARYSGTTAIPPAGAALVGVPAAHIVGGRLASNAGGADGNTWLPVR